MSEVVSTAEERAASDRDRSSLRVPIWLERTSAWSWRLILITIAVGGTLWLALQLRVVLVPLLLALLLSTTLRPIAGLLGRHRFPGALAAAIPIVMVGGVVGLASWFVYRRTSATLAEDEMTGDVIRVRIEEWLMDGPLRLSQDQIDTAEAELRSWLSGGISSLGIQEAALAVQIVGGALLTLVLTYFLIKDGPMLWRSITSKINPIRVDAVRDSGSAVASTMSAYLRSVVLTGLADALMIGLGLWILGVPLLVPLMILTALAGLFPIVGAVVAGGAAAAVALITVDATTAAWVVVLTLVVQQVEGNVLQPLIMARQVSIHPIVVLLSLTAGGAIAGLAGAFLAVPVVASALAAIAAFSAEMEVDTVHDLDLDLDVDVDDRRGADVDAP